MQPLLSVVIPVFNAEKYIGQVINDIIKQTYTNWELLLVDDGSNDGTNDIIKSFSDERVKYISRSRDPKGANTCRNIGRELSTGKYIIFFDADDVIKDCCFKQRVEFMEKNPDVDFATFKGRNLELDKSGKEVLTGRYWGINPNKDILESFLGADYSFGVWNNIYRMKSFKDFCWDEKLKIYMDFDHIVRSIIDGNKHMFCDECEPDYYYRCGLSGALTGNFVSNAKHESTLYLFDKIQSLIEKLDKKYKESFKKFYSVQFERLTSGGSREQIDEFCLHTEKYYPELVKKYRKSIKKLSRELELTPDKRNHKKILLYNKIYFDRKFFVIYLRQKLHLKER